MRASTLRNIIAMGAVTGMRSLTGVAALAARRSNPVAAIFSVAAIGEMIADKTRLVGDRTDPLPLAGRAAIGAAVGAFIAHERADNAMVGAAIGATSAIVATHLAYRLRQAAPNNVVAGLVEDSLAARMASLYA